MSTNAGRRVPMGATLVVAIFFGACSPSQSTLDADLFFTVCYQPDLGQGGADICVDPLSIIFDYDGDGSTDEPIPNSCYPGSGEPVIVAYEYAVKTFDSGGARVYTDGATAGDGTVIGNHIEYQSPNYRETRDSGEISWYLTGVLDIYDGQPGDNPCPGLGQGSTIAPDRSTYCVEGSETIWVVESTDPDIPAGSPRGSCNQRFVLTGERVE